MSVTDYWTLFWATANGVLDESAFLWRPVALIAALDGLTP